MFRAVRSLSSFSSNSANFSANKSYDVVIVGGGHNGLVAACYLQKAGAQVCVLERRHVVGGCAVTEEIIPGFKFSRASYVLSLLRPHIIQDLELKKHGLKLHLRNPSSYTPLHEKYWTSINKAKSLLLGADDELNAQQIAQFSVKDAKVYAEYEHYLQKIISAVDPLLDVSAQRAQDLMNGSLMDQLKMLLKHPELRSTVKTWSKLRKDIPALMELITAPASKIMNSWFESEPLRATLATDAVIGAMASPWTPGTGYVLLHHVMGELEGVKGAWGYPEGGMGSVTQAMASAAKSRGVDIFTEVEVKEILCNSGKAVGILTDQGQEIEAKLVLSNATPATTFLKLLPLGTLDSRFENVVKSIDYTSPVTKINVALSSLPESRADPCQVKGQPLPLHQTTIHLNCENMNMLEQAYQDAHNGKISERPMLELVFPSSLDQTLAPPGAHVCLIFSQYTPYTLNNGQQWDNVTKDAYAKKVFSIIDEYMTGFSSSIVGYEVLSPPDLEDIFGITGGNIFHGSMSLDQLFMLRAGGVAGAASPQTPIANLLLCGSGAHPGGGVMGSAGYLAALHAISLLKKN